VHGGPAGEGGEGKRQRGRARGRRVRLARGEGERERVTEVDELTGMPQAGDALLYAVPMCGPLSAVQNWKFRCEAHAGAHEEGER